MKIQGLTWAGIRTEKFEEMISFYKDILNLVPINEEKGFAAFKFPNGDTVEIFADWYSANKYFTTGPVLGFEVDDIDSARKEMETKGVEFIEEIKGDPKRSRWIHFRGVDGNVYELKWHPPK